MTIYSRSDLAMRVLRDLTIVDATETPSAEDLSFAQETVASVVAQLATDRIVIWDGSDQALPESYLVQLSKRIGLDIGSTFGLFSMADAEKAKPVANAALRKMNAIAPSGDVGDNTYY